MRSDLPDLEWVSVVGGEPGPDNIPFGALVGDEPLDAVTTVDPSEPALVAYTSGTTSDPKGVVHAHRTIGAEIRQLGGVHPSAAVDQEGKSPALSVAPASITGAPVGHGIGMIAALLMPVYGRRPVHLIDAWDPGRVLHAMLEDSCSAGHGATVFFTSLLDHPDFDPACHVPLMPVIGLGGAAVPAAVGERAEGLGITTTRSFGSTEHPSITGCSAASPRDKRLHTDGEPLAGVELRLVDDNGRDVALGEPGEIWSRGPDCFVGYTDPALTAAAFAPGGWYMTGDVGVLDADGYLAITDRKKDIIIRGGENVSAAEVEEILVRMPDVAEVAVVAAPDARAGRDRLCPFPDAAPRAGPRPPHRSRRTRTRRSCPSEVARADPRGARVPADTERQDPEVRAPAATARRGRGMIEASAPPLPLGGVRMPDVSRFVSGPLGRF